MGLDGALTEAVDCSLQHAKCTVHISLLLLAVVSSLSGRENSTDDRSICWRGDSADRSMTMRWCVCM